MKEFIDLCTSMRAKAKTATEANSWKLVANSVYGKLIENIFKRVTCSFIHSEKEAIRKATCPTFKGSMVCSDDLTISFHKKKSVHMKQCWALGFSVLEISKYIMQKLYYEQVLPKLGGHEKVDLIMSDTDSFILEIQGLTNNEVMKRLSSVMDFSNLPKNHVLFDLKNARLPGLLKNEVPDGAIIEVVAVKPKAYALQTISNEDLDQTVRTAKKIRYLNLRKDYINKHLKIKIDSRAKGVKRAVKDKLPFSHFKSCVTGNTDYVQVYQRSLQSKTHRNYLQEALRVAMTPLDDKRYQLCNIHSTPYGSYLINLCPTTSQNSPVETNCYKCYIKSSKFQKKNSKEIAKLLREKIRKIKKEKRNLQKKK